MSALPRIHRSLAVILAAGMLTLGTGSRQSPQPPPRTPTSPPPRRWTMREGPQFYTGVLIDVSGAIDGDVYAAGQSVTISGDVTGDVIAAAQTITITGTVDGDVRLAGQDVSITGEVSRSGTVFAANFTVGDTGSVGDDLVAAAGRVSIAGEVGRDVVASVGRLIIDGSVGGSVTYVSDDEARIAEGAVDGTVERVEPPQTPRVEVSPWAVFIGWFLGVFYALVALSLITLLAGLLFPRWLHRVTDHLVPSPWKALLVGIRRVHRRSHRAAVPGRDDHRRPARAGRPAGVDLDGPRTFVYSAYYIGRLMFRGTQHPVVKSLVGGVILIVALQIPWLNILVWLAMVFFGLGAQLLEIHRQRPWHLTPATTTAPHLPAGATAEAQQPALRPSHHG